MHFSVGKNALAAAEHAICFDDVAKSFVLKCRGQQGLEAIAFLKGQDNAGQ